MAQEPQRTNPKYTYVDLPEISETFADSIHEMFFDGHTLRLTLAVSRMGASHPPDVTAGRRYPVCRLVLTAATAADLVNRLNQLRAALAQAQPRIQSPAGTNKDS